MAPKSLTLSVQNLPPQTSKQDIQNQFTSAIFDCDPLVGPIINDPHSNNLSCTVTLKSEDACKTACKKLHNVPFWATRGSGQSNMYLDYDFMGLIPLEEHENPTFDFYFVHGLGGHAFDSWASFDKGIGHKSVKMWPRDLLPPKLKAKGLHGRYSILGYNANVAGNAGNTTITSAAIELLYRLRNDRPDGCTRPIFFCCHSLGGLVVARALCLALDDSISKEDDRYLRGLVKGVITFGTPFWGSFTATTLSPFVATLEKVNRHRVNSSLVKNLSANDEELTELVGHFKQVRQHHGIDIKMFYETLPVISILVTRPVSATGPFAEFVDPVPINAHHTGMIKFSAPSDPKWTSLGESLLRLTMKHMGHPDHVPSPAHPRPPFSPPPQPATRRSTGHASPESVGLALRPAQTLPRRPQRTSLFGGQRQNIPEPSARTSNKHTDTPGHVAGPKVRDMPEYTKAGGNEDSLSLERLAQWDTVFVVDDTGSMQLPAHEGGEDGKIRWTMLVEAMQYIADIAAQNDSDGVDVWFLCTKEEGRDAQGHQRQYILKRENLRSGQDILDLLNKVDVTKNGGGTHFEPILSPILNEHVMRFQKYHDGLQKGENGEAPKPLNLIVLTDGDATDKKSTEKLLKDTAERLDRMWAPSFQIGVQFVQVGDDASAGKYLKRLDDRLKTEYNVRDVSWPLNRVGNGIC